MGGPFLVTLRYGDAGIEQVPHTPLGWNQITFCQTRWYKHRLSFLSICATILIVLQLLVIKYSPWLCYNGFKIILQRKKFDLEIDKSK